MIEFEIIRSPDLDIQQKYSLYYNQIIIGRNRGHALIKDNQLLDSHLMLEVIENDLILHPQPGVSHYLLDGKRATNVRKIKVGQKITIGDTEFVIKDFKETVFKTKKMILDEKLAHLMEIDSPQLAIIEEIAEMMKDDV
jgi:hypothetical protein